MSRRNPDGSLTVTTRWQWRDAIDEAIRRKAVLEEKFARPAGFWKFKVQRVRTGFSSHPWTWAVTFRSER